MDDVKSLITFRHFISSNYSQYTPDKYLNINGGDLYFMKETEDMYLWNYASIIAIFILMKLIQIFYIKINKVSPKFRSKGKGVL